MVKMGISIAISVIQDSVSLELNLTLKSLRGRFTGRALPRQCRWTTRSNHCVLRCGMLAFWGMLCLFRREITLKIAFQAKQKSYGTIPPKGRNENINLHISPFPIIPKYFGEIVSSLWKAVGTGLRT